MGNLLGRLNGNRARCERIAELEAQIAESQARIAESEAWIAESQARRAELEARSAESQTWIAESEAWIAESQAQRRAERALRLGTYYSTVEDVWEPEEREFSQESLDAMRRSYQPQFYRAAVEAALCDDPDPAFEEASGSECNAGSSLEEKSTDSKTEKSRKRRLQEVSFDGTRRVTAAVAHLIPYPPRCANLFAPLAEAAAGVNFDSAEEPAKKKQRQMVLIHGQYEVQQNQGKSSNESKKIRKDSTGIKHCQTNMARVVGQRQLFDFNPSQLLIPILSLQDTLEHGRESSKKKYQVFVVCTNPSTYADCLWQEEYENCTKNDIETTTETLASFVKAAAQAHLLADMNEITKLKNPQRSAMLKTRGELEKEKKVKVPRMLAWREGVRLAKVTLDMENPQTHQECDPFLLFVRAAVSWSHIQNQLLLPSCQLPHDCEDCLDDGVFQCICDSYDPCEYIPGEIYVANEAANDFDDCAL